MASEVHSILSKVALALHECNNEVVFIGGFVIELYKQKSMDISPRVTNDVDCIIQIISRGKFYIFQEAIRLLSNPIYIREAIRVLLPPSVSISYAETVHNEFKLITEFL